MALSDRCDRCGLAPYAFSFLGRSDGSVLWLCGPCVEAWHLEQGAEIIARQQITARDQYPEEPAFTAEAVPAEEPASRPRPQAGAQAEDAGSAGATPAASATAGPDDRRGDARLEPGSDLEDEPEPQDPGA